MATYTFVDFEHPEAMALARLRSIRKDLESTGELCRHFVAQFGAGDASAEVIDAFTTAILVRYSRAFVSGVRQGLGKTDLDILTPEQRLLHEQFRAYRDKHIAHSVNAFEDTRIQARFCKERVQEEGITSISAAHYRVFGISLIDAKSIEALSTVFLDHVDRVIESEQKRLLEFIRTLKVDDVLSQTSSPLMSADRSKIAKRRARQ